jgi:hypothetical protein
VEVWRGEVAVRAMTAGRSPYWETMEAKCSGIVSRRRAGWEVVSKGPAAWEGETYTVGADAEAQAVS